MSDSIYKVITLVGTSSESWENAAMAAVASQPLTRELRIPEVVKQDMVMLWSPIPRFTLGNLRVPAG